MSNSIVEESTDIENILKVRCHSCDHRIVVENPVPLASCFCPDCGVKFTIPKQLGSCLLESMVTENEIIGTYRGTDQKLNRQVIFKLINKDFINHDEVYNIGIGTFVHDNAATIYGTQEFDGDLLVLSEYINGHTLEYHLNHGQNLAIESIIETAKDISNLMLAAAEKDIHHGHLSLDAIWVDEEGEVKVADFFIRQKVRENCTQNITSQVLDQNYFRDVNASGANEESDLYSLGVCLYKMSTGRFPDKDLVEPKIINDEVPDFLNTALVGLLRSEINSFTSLTEALNEKKVKETKTKDTPSIKISKEKKTPIISANVETASENKAEKRSSGARLTQQVKYLKNQLLIARLFFLAFAAAFVIFAAARYMPNSGLGKNSERILNQTLDKMFAGEKDELDMDEILKEK